VPGVGFIRDPDYAAKRQPIDRRRPATIRESRGLRSRLIQECPCAETGPRGQRLDSAFGKFVLHDLAAFHHELHSLEFRDVGERIAGHGHEIRVVTRARDRLGTGVWLPI
jgi:hypothetical protein